MKSIKWKLVALYLGLVLIVMVVSGTFILLSLQNIEVGKGRDQLTLYAEKIRDQVVMSYDEINFQNVLEEFYKLDTSSTQLQGNILNAQGETIASTSYVSRPFPTYKNSLIISALSGDEAFDSDITANDGAGGVKELMGYALPIIINDSVKYVIYTQMDASAMNQSLTETRQTILISVALALLLTAVMGYIFSKTLTDPILLLSRKANELAEGNLKQKIPVYSSDEIGRLTESFNYMASELNKNISEISREKNKMEIILYNMTDGVVSFDRDGAAVLSNAAALKMLGLTEMHLSFTEFIKEFDINSGVYLDVEREAAKQSIFALGELYINASFSQYYNERREPEGIVVVLQDITEQKKLDDMRKEFVANVSHELRTPLTTVKSYTETLMEGALDDRATAMEFLEIIDSEADRMAFLVRDLLQLSRFDNKQVQFKLVLINVSQFLAHNIKQNRIHAENKNQTLTLDPCPEDIFITADRDRVTQVFNNVLTNAIKYSLPGAKIRVFVTEDEKYYKISVSDTGMGIKKEDLERVFERFYRVDKARSRAMGGTGLGLAIAREIMESHKGRITAESEYGKGTTMTMWFLKNPEKE